MYTFDEWREKYNTLTMQEQIAFHNHLESQYPDQAHFDIDFAIKVFDFVKPKEVTEAGGWKGDLANQLIPKYDIQYWLNIELCESAIQNTHCKFEAFKNYVPESFDWFDSKLYKGLFVATNLIEHLSNEHFNTLAKSLSKVEYVYFESPLEDESQSWNGYLGTHKLEYGWNDIKKVMKYHEVILENKYCKLFKKKQ